MNSNRFHIIHTNDFHSNFDLWPATVAKIRELQKELSDKGERYLTLDIGDHVDRAHYITEGSMGKANIELLNQVGYDYVTIGNNEGMTLPKTHLDDLYQGATFKVIVNNLFEQDGTLSRWAIPYYIHTIEGLQIGLLGATVNFSPFYQQLGWKIENPIVTLAEHIKEIRERVDLIIILSHLGLEKDKELAKSIAGIDLILGAHTHHVLHDGVRIDNTYINQAGKFGEYIGLVTIEATPGNGKKVYPTCLKVDQHVRDEAAAQMIAKWKDIAQEKLSEEIAFLQEAFNVSWHAESVLANLLAEGLKDWCQTPIAIVNSGQILESLPQGSVTKAALLQACPHPINPCIVALTGLQIKNILHRSLSQQQQQQEIKGFGFRGKVLGMLSVDGLEIFYRAKAPKEYEILKVIIDNQLLEDEREYEVATIDMFTFSMVIPEIKRSKIIKYFMPEFLRDVLASRLANGQFERAKVMRWNRIE